MGSEILINSGIQETRIARIAQGQLVELHVERKNDLALFGNIYKGRVVRVLPGMQAAFVEIGLERTGYLYVKHILDPNRAPDIEDETDEHDDEPNTQGSTTPDISKLLREGESILVQILKEPMGTKGARLTGYVRIPGRYLVYLPESTHLGVSRKIEDAQERDRLKDIIEKNRPGTGGFIIRTNAEGASAKNLKDDMEYLIKLWGTIKKSAEKQKTPGLIHAELDMVLKTLRDRVDDNVDRILVDDLETLKKVQRFVQNYLPRFKKRIEVHSGPAAIFEHFGVEMELKRALARKIWLKSGGFIVIDETEALTSIDVNTGKFVGKRNLEDTLLQTNLEAAKEIAYQIRLRNLGGIIVVDFIDMGKSHNRDLIYHSFVEELRKDPVKTQVLPISELGLIQMTRKRTEESLMHQLTSPCGYCDGRGYTKSKETIVSQILREAWKESKQSSHCNALAIFCHPDIAECFANESRISLEQLEREIGRKLTVKVDGKLHLEDFEIYARET